MNLSSYYAMKFIRKYKAQSALIVVGLALGVAVLVITTWLVEGMRMAMDETYAGRIPHVVVRQSAASKPGLEDYAALEETIGKAVSGLKAITPTLDLSVVLRVPERSEAPAGEIHMTLRGLEMIRAGDLYPLAGAMIRGRTFMEGREIVLGTLLAERLSLGIGDAVVLDDEQGQLATFSVVGIFDLKQEQENASMGFVDLEALQSAFGLTGTAQQIELQLEDAFEANAVSASLTSVLGRPDLETGSWEMTHRQLFEAATLQRNAINLIWIAVTMIILIGAVLILSLSVNQRAPQLAALKSLGLRDDQGGMVFAFYSLYMSLFGVLWGILAGSGLIRLYKNQSIWGLGAYQQTPDPNLGSLVLPLAFLPLASSLAAWGVARWVLGKDPAEVIRRG